MLEQDVLCRTDPPRKQRCNLPDDYMGQLSKECGTVPFGYTILPAPVVPLDLFDARIAGDWWMTRSLPAIVSSIEEALESTKPRSCDGKVCEKRRKASIYGFGSQTLTFGSFGGFSSIPSSGSTTSSPSISTKS